MKKAKNKQTNPNAWIKKKRVNYGKITNLANNKKTNFFIII